MTTTAKRKPVGRAQSRAKNPTAIEAAIKKRPAIHQLMVARCLTSGVLLSELLGDLQTSSVTYCRHGIWATLRKHPFRMSLNEIATLFCCDYSSVRSAVQRLAE